MCFIWEGKIEKCQHCSVTEFQNVLRVVYHIEPTRPTQQTIARTTPRPLNQGHPQPPRQRFPTVENPLDLEQDLTRQARPSSSRLDALINGAAQHKRQRENADQPSSSTHRASINETPQNKRQKVDLDQKSTLRHGGRIGDQCQNGRQGPTPDQTSSLSRDTRMHGAAQLGQQVQSHSQHASSRHDALSDQTNRRGQRERQQDPASSSKHNTTTDLTEEKEDEGTGTKTSRTHSRVEDMEVLTAGMNKIPPPCWEDEQVILPLVKQQLGYEEYCQRKEQELNEHWAMYGKEREALAASHTSDEEEHWTPDFEEVEILEREIPLEEDIWARSVLEGEAHMGNIFGEDGTWPQEPPEEADIWTREEGGMLSAAMLRRLSRVFTFQATVEEERLQRSDENERLPYPSPTQEEMRLHEEL